MTFRKKGKEKLYQDLLRLAVAWPAAYLSGGAAEELDALAAKHAPDNLSEGDRRACVSKALRVARGRAVRHQRRG